VYVHVRMSLQRRRVLLATLGHFIYTLLLTILYYFFSSKVRVLFLYAAEVLQPNDVTGSIERCEIHLVSNINRSPN